MTLNYMALGDSGEVPIYEWSGWRFDSYYEIFSLLEQGRANGLKFMLDCLTLVMNLENGCVKVQFQCCNVMWLPVSDTHSMLR